MFVGLGAFTFWGRGRMKVWKCSCFLGNWNQCLKCVTETWASNSPFDRNQVFVSLLASHMHEHHEGLQWFQVSGLKIPLIFVDPTLTSFPFRSLGCSSGMNVVPVPGLSEAPTPGLAPLPSGPQPPWGPLHLASDHNVAFVEAWHECGSDFSKPGRCKWKFKILVGGTIRIVLKPGRLLGFSAPRLSEHKG